MKKHILTVFVALSCLLTLFCCTKIIALENQIGYLQGNLSNQIGSVNATVSGIYANVDSMLQRQANLLVESGYEFGAVDIDKAAVDLHCTVTPKEFSPNQTTASLVCQGQEYVMTLVNGVFGATVAVPLFEAMEIERVILTTGDVQQVEVLDWQIMPRYEVLPQIAVQWNGSATMRSDTYRWQGDLAAQITSSREFQLQTVFLVELQNGEEISRTLLEPECISDYGYHVGYALDQTYTLAPDSRQELYLEAVDGHNLQYRAVIGCWTTNENAVIVPNQEDETAGFGSAVSIYDASGQLLYADQDNWASGIY